MPSDSLTKIRAEAKRRRIPWAAVQAAYREVKSLEWEKRQRPNEVREAAWCFATPRGCWPFWRHGFLSRFGKRFARGGDLTHIPKYDTIAQELSWYFPEYAGPDGTERLWEFLMSPYDRMPDRERMYVRALNTVLADRRARKVSPDLSAAIPF